MFNHYVTRFLNGKVLVPQNCSQYTIFDVLTGLAETEWPGRNQTLKHGPVTYFLDGAHTTRSMQACVRWFNEIATHHERNAG